MEKILHSCFPEKYIAVVLGGKEATTALLEEPFDYIFYTGNPAVGKVVMTAAAKNLTPVTLELGGKSPCIVDNTADSKIAARRIAWGKCLNAGQTCVAPDYLYVQKDIKETFLKDLESAFRQFYGKKPEQNPAYPKIINTHHYERLKGLLDAQSAILYGGGMNADTLQIAPTLVDGVTWDNPLMAEEIFGPILPILTFDHIEEIITPIKAHPKPLALYLFTQNPYSEKRILEEISFGGGCINETILHMVGPKMPFGGVGNSGMGAYHGKYSFTTFSHQKSVLHGTFQRDPKIRYTLHQKSRLPLLKTVLR